jgi:hypothetical protein
LKSSSAALRLALGRNNCKRFVIIMQLRLNLIDDSDDVVNSLFLLHTHLAIHIFQLLLRGLLNLIFQVTSRADYLMEHETRQSGNLST